VRHLVDVPNLRMEDAHGAIAADAISFERVNLSHQSRRLLSQKGPDNRLKLAKVVSSALCNGATRPSSV
jgi:hypothetical protein